MATKTYIAPGLLDFRLVVRAGKAWTTIDFTGGRSSGYGNCWARFSTSDAVVQAMIENSPEYRNGKVKSRKV